MLDGHAPKSVTERHHMGRSLETMARAVACPSGLRSPSARA